MLGSLPSRWRTTSVRRRSPLIRDTSATTSPSQTTWKRRCLYGSKRCVLTAKGGMPNGFARPRSVPASVIGHVARAAEEGDLPRLEPLAHPLREHEVLLVVGVWQPAGVAQLVCEHAERPPLEGSHVYGDVVDEGAERAAGAAEDVLDDERGDGRSRARDRPDGVAGRVASEEGPAGA